MPDVIELYLDEIEGSGFSTSTDSLKEISDDVDKILAITRSDGDISVTSSETNLYIDNAPTTIINGLSIAIDMSNMATGDIYEFREYYRIASGGSYLDITDGIVLSGAQSQTLQVIYLNAYRYGVKITAKKLAGTDRSFKIEVMRNI